MKQYEFEAINKRTKRVERIRATAKNHDTARAAIVAYYADQFDVAGFCCDVNPAHSTLGEIDASNQ